LRLAIKRDGTWIYGSGTLFTGNNWSYNDSGSAGEIVWSPDIDIANNSDPAADQDFTEAVIMASQDLGQTLSFLNADQASVDNILCPINTITGSPVTIQNGQSLRLTSLRIPINE
jgi:hypothetical protein